MDKDSQQTDSEEQLADGVYLGPPRQSSEVIRDILGRPPSWMTAWGTTLFVLILCLFFIFTWIIKYPDVIQGEVILTTVEPPIRVYPAAEGLIRKLNIADEALVEAGEIIAEINNPIALNRIESLKTLLPSVREEIDSGQASLAFPQSHSATPLGSLQADYNELRNEWRSYQAFLTQDYHNNLISKVSEQLLQTEVLIEMLREEEALRKKEYANQQVIFQKESQSFQKGFSSKAEHLRQENTLIQKKSFYQQAQRELQNTIISLSEKKQDYLQLKKEKNELFRSYENRLNSSIQNLWNGIYRWEKRYLIKAPVSGKIVYLKHLSEKQHVSSAHPLFAVISQQEAYIGIIKLNRQATGKIKRGQVVNLKFYDYPADEFGVVTGYVERISSLPQDNASQVYVRLDQGLSTVYGKKITFRPEMEGEAKVITKDLRLIERFLFDIRALLNST